jgi:ABC-type bacteriocin/lantibiotic exporter with double-glycine peptidase domain
MTVLGLVPALSGRVLWDGLAVNAVDPAELRKRIGFAGPEPYLLDTDILTNLRFGLDRTNVTDAEIYHALHVASAEFVYDLEGALKHELSEGGDGISAGQKQRLALARCILRQPDVLILDEATSNIDEETERLIIDRLRAAYPKLMIVAVSHRSSLRKFATSVTELGAGF